MSISSLSQFDGELIDGLLFCAMTSALFEQVRSATGGPSRLRMRATKVEKRLIEELLPICKYVQAKYRAGRYISVRWVNSNKGQTTISEKKCDLSPERWKHCPDGGGHFGRQRETEN